MSMTECGECKHAISTTATMCPNCGAKVPRTKWWFWVPLAVIAAFLIYGMTIPEYVSQAREVKKVCEQLAPFQKDECQRTYDRTISAGKAEKNPTSTSSYVPSTFEREDAAKRDAAERAIQLTACKVNISKNIEDYQRLMTQGNYWAASVSIRRCSQLMDDPKLVALVANGEIKSFIKDIENPKTTSNERIRQIEALTQDYPEQGAKYAPLLSKLKATQ